MRLLNRSGSTDAARVRRAAVVLLLLTLHAVQAGATHLPRRAPTPTTRTDYAVSFARSRDAAAAAASASTESGAHTQCLLCRLQRSLSTCLGNSAPVAFSPPQDWLVIESASAVTPHSTVSGIAPGRAPPRSRKP